MLMKYELMATLKNHLKCTVSHVLSHFMFYQCMKYLLVAEGLFVKWWQPECMQDESQFILCKGNYRQTAAIFMKCPEFRNFKLITMLHMWL